MKTIPILEPVAIPPEDEALRPEVRRFLAERLADVPLHQRAHTWMGFDAEFSRAMAQRGWVGMTLPRAVGGGGRSPFARFVLSEEMLSAGAPVAGHWIAERQSGPLIVRYGTEAQRAFYLPRICRAEAFFCIGMSEPGAGSDLASVRTRAERTASGWRLNGQKIWTTIAQHAHYTIALVRTSGTTEDRQKGLSQFIVDLKLPGVTVRPIVDIAGDQHFCEVFFENVELAEDALIGSEGEGWTQVTAELAFERSGPERILSSMVLVDAFRAWLAKRNDDHEADTVLLGEITARLAVLRTMSLAVTQRLVKGESPMLEATVVKDLGTTFEQDIVRLVADRVASAPDAPAPVELRRALDYLQRMSPSFSLRGGTREILRGVIARGLGLR